MKLDKISKQKTKVADERKDGLKVQSGVRAGWWQTSSMTVIWRGGW